MRSSRLVPSRGPIASPALARDLDHLVDPDRARDRVARGLHDAQRLLDARRAHHQAELVAAQPRDQDAVRHISAQPVGDLGQNLVFAGVADRLLHLVEAAEIEQRHRHQLVRLAFGERLVGFVPHAVQIGQAGDRILIGQPLHLAGALRQQLVEPAQLPHREQREGEQSERDQAAERQQPLGHRGRGPLRLPTEPADDPALGIDQGLHCMRALGRFFGKTQILQPRSGFEDVDRLRIDLAEAGRNHLQRLDRAAQRLTLGAFEIVVGLQRQHQAQHATEHGGGDDHHRQRRHQFHERCFATPQPRRPPKPGAQRRATRPPRRPAVRGLVTQFHRVLRLKPRVTKTFPDGTITPGW